MKYAKLAIAILVPLAILLVPTSAIPLNELTVVQQRILAIFAFAVLSWVLEIIPIFATSILIIVAELVLISDKAFKPFIVGIDNSSLVSYKAIFGTFASPIILLFLGGFFLAMAATKYRLDTNLVRIGLKFTGTNPKVVLLALMVITAVFSMFMSNTATTAMMLAVLAPVLKELAQGDKGRIAYVLGIPFAANVGGMGTPIGTPPNAVAQKYLQSVEVNGKPIEMAVDFGSWMCFAVPYVIVLLIIVWLLLIKIFPIEADKVEIKVKGKFLKTKEAIVVYITFAATIILWLTGKFHGMTSHIVAMIPVAVFCSTKIITTQDLKKMSWDVLWLVSGGIALGLGLGSTGLSKLLVSVIPFDQMSLLLIISASAIVGVMMSTFMSNTATANLLLPIMSALGVSLMEVDGTAKIGMMLIIGVTFACSLAMAMPISTPPNALAHATGQIGTGDMAKAGMVVGAIGLLLTFVMLFIMNSIGYFAI